VAIYCESDTSHITFADEAVALPRPSSYLDVDHLVALCKERNIDAVHPGYGFLSESAEFASKLRDHGIAFVGPSPEILDATGSKLKAKELAKECRVPVIPALEGGAGSWQDAATFADQVGYPIMLKAVDGGGGRGIRLAKQRSELQSAFDRAVAESPSRTVFAEKALVEGWRHIEIQILGDGVDVRHFWERECSIQRR
jgi:acetyl/propionyl-CoA carboxylase alpha subunit